MAQPYYSPTSPISFPKAVGRRYFIKLANTTDPIFRVPADSSTYLWIPINLTRQVQLKYREKDAQDGEKKIIYDGRDLLKIAFDIITIDERDRDRLNSWFFYGENVSVMEVLEEDTANPDFIQIGPYQVSEWKIISMKNVNAPGNLKTITYNIELQEVEALDNFDATADTFFPFKYMIRVVDGINSYYVPSTWTPGSPSTSKGLFMERDFEHMVELNFSQSQIAFGSQIIEYKSRSNVMLEISFVTENIEEISVLEWAKDTIGIVEFWEWSEHPDTSGARKYEMNLNNLSTYSLTSLPAIAPDLWRITELSYIQNNKGEYLASIVLKEIR